jgi:hypothetical protein
VKDLKMAPENCYIDGHFLQKGETQDTDKVYITCKTGNYI